MKKSLVVLSFLGLFINSANGFCEDDVFIDFSVLSEVNLNTAHKNVPPMDYPAASFAENPSVSAIPVTAVNTTEQGLSTIINLPTVKPKFPVVEPKKQKQKIVSKPEVKTKSTAVKEIKPIKKVEVKKAEPKKEIKTDPLIVEVAAKEEILKDFDVEVKNDSLKDIQQNVEEKVKETEQETKVKQNLDKEASIAKALEYEDKELDKAVKELSDVIEGKDKETVKMPKVEAPAAEGVKTIERDLVNYITFDNDVTELNSEQKLQLSRIVTSFEKPEKNRIAIFSYNLDNGEDVFKRKRQTLTRATEVRHYLISLGYKNFSIKVINVDETSNKLNSVEVTELK